MFLRYLSGILFCVFIYSCSQGLIREGAIKYRITYSGNIDSTSVKLLPKMLTINFKNNEMRLKMSGGLAELKPIVIIDGLKGEITTINSLTSKVETRKLLKRDTTLIKSGKEEIISGHKCEIYSATNKNAKYNVWIAEDMPFTVVGTSRLEGFYISGYKGIPLKIRDQEQDFTVNYTVDSISTGSQPDSLFSLTRK